jgi:hypothetical protein
MSITRAEHLWTTSEPAEAAGLRWPVPDSETQRWYAQKSPAGAKPTLDAGEVGVEVSAWIQPSTVARMQTEPPRFDSRFWWHLVRPELSFEIPLAPSGWMTNRGRGLRLDRVEREPNNLSVLLVETRPVLIRDLLREGASHGAWFHLVDWNRETLLVAINRRGREIVEFFPYERGTARMVIVNGVAITWRDRMIGQPDVIRDGKRVRIAPRMDGDMLGVMTLREEALFSREVKINRFEMTGRGQPAR